MGWLSKLFGKNDEEVKESSSETSTEETQAQKESTEDQSQE